MNGYTLTKQEDLIAVILTAYKTQHPEAFDGLVQVEKREDGSEHISMNDKVFIDVVDKAVAAYAKSVETFDPGLARVIRRENGTLFNLDATYEFRSWLKNLVE